MLSSGSSGGGGYSPSCMFENADSHVQVGAAEPLTVVSADCDCVLLYLHSHCLEGPPASCLTRPHPPAPQPPPLPYTSSLPQAKARTFVQIIEPLMTLLATLGFYILYWWWRNRRSRKVGAEEAQGQGQDGASGDQVVDREGSRAGAGAGAGGDSADNGGAETPRKLGKYGKMLKTRTIMVMAAQAMVEEAAKTRRLPLKEKLKVKAQRIKTKLIFIVKHTFAFDFT